MGRAESGSEGRLLDSCPSSLHDLHRLSCSQLDVVYVVAHVPEGSILLHSLLSLTFSTLAGTFEHANMHTQTHFASTFILFLQDGYNLPRGKYTHPKV